MLPLSEYDTRALHVALEHEYRSLALHDRIIRDFGPTPLIEDTRDVRTGHIQVLEWLHRRYGVALPKHRRRIRIPQFTDTMHACAAAIEAEKEQLVLYLHLIENAHDPDVQVELRNLERAARNGHLRALEAWARQLCARRHAHAGVHQARGEESRISSSPWDFETVSAAPSVLAPEWICPSVWQRCYRD